jgi:hypothetical protein
MDMKARTFPLHCGQRRFLMLMATAASIWLAAQPARAADNGPTQTGDICMQKVYGTPVTNANKLNCTANDIRLSRAISVSPASCVRGTTFDLQATFETVVTANSRYDAGFFFRTDGGTNARGDGVNAAGKCSLSALDRNIAPALNLDSDTAGDLNSGTYALTFTIPGVKCEDRDGDQQLDLPNCTSWHSNQGTTGTLGDAFTFNPDTKSKCVCDDTFQVPVKVEDATLSVDKTASPTQIEEPGGQVTFTAKITNTSTVESVQITSIIDNIHGNKGADTTSLDNTCDDLIGTTLAAGASASCTFKGDVWGNAGYRETDKVTATAYQSSNGATISGFDTADVDIVNLPGDAEPTLAKTAQGVANCRMDATYQVVVNNNSTVDKLTVKSLTDDKFGDITQVQGKVLSTTCSDLPKLLDTNKNYTCQFVGRIESSSCNFTHTNTVTADVIDDDNVSFGPSNDAKVIVKVETPTP